MFEIMTVFAYKTDIIMRKWHDTDHLYTPTTWKAMIIGVQSKFNHRPSRTLCAYACANLMGGRALAKPVRECPWFITSLVTSIAPLLPQRLGCPGWGRVAPKAKGFHQPLGKPRLRRRVDFVGFADVCAADEKGVWNPGAGALLRLLYGPPSFAGPQVLVRNLDDVEGKIARPKIASPDSDHRFEHRVVNGALGGRGVALALIPDNAAELEWDQLV